MNHLAGLARSDVDELRQVDLERAGVVSKGEVKRAQDRGIGHKSTGARRTGNERARSSRGMA
jgi:hypothetical protein